MLDMVAEKAEYYSAQPARKVEMEKAAYRQIRDEGATQMREKPIVTGASSSQTRESPQTESMNYKTLLEDKRAFVRERESIKSQLVDGEIAYLIGKGRWVAQMHDGTERVISTDPNPNTLRQKPSQLINDDLLDAIEEARLGARRGSGLIVNRHTSACATSKGEKCDCSCGGAQHGSQAGATPPKTGEAEKTQSNNEAVQPKSDEEPEASADFEGLVSSFKVLIEKGEKPTLSTLQSQISQDPDGKKFKLSSAALAEAWHSYSLDKFQDTYARNPKNNVEFRTFQKKSGVPPEFIGGK